MNEGTRTDTQDQFVKINCKKEFFLVFLTLFAFLCFLFTIGSSHPLRNGALWLIAVPAILLSIGLLCAAITDSIYSVPEEEGPPEWVRRLYFVFGFAPDLANTPTKKVFYTLSRWIFLYLFNVAIIAGVFVGMQDGPQDPMRVVDIGDGQREVFGVTDKFKIVAPIWPILNDSRGYPRSYTFAPSDAKHTKPVRTRTADNKCLALDVRGSAEFTPTEAQLLEIDAYLTEANLDLNYYLRRAIEVAIGTAVGDLTLAEASDRLDELPRLITEAMPDYIHITRRGGHLKVSSVQLCN